MLQAQPPSHTMRAIGCPEIQGKHPGTMLSLSSHQVTCLPKNSIHSDSRCTTICTQYKANRKLRQHAIVLHNKHCAIVHSGQNALQ